MEPSGWQGILKWTQSPRAAALAKGSTTAALTLATAMAMAKTEAKNFMLEWSGGVLESGCFGFGNVCLLLVACCLLVKK